MKTNLLQRTTMRLAALSSARVASTE